MLFTLLLDDILFELEKSGDGCRIGTNYYVWDTLMISNCYVQVIKVYKECLIYVINFLVVMAFNVTKTMCIEFHYGKHSGEIPQYPVYLGLDKRQWYSQVKHLGHIFNCCSSLSADVDNQKGQFIGCVNSIITQFGFPHPVCKMKLLVTHAYSFYGSSLWDLYGNACNHLYTTWNIAVRRL